jgi:hypothetical protein
MLTVTFPVHPLSRKVLLAHYGNEPIVLDNHDPLFDVISSPRLTPVKDLKSLSAEITFAFQPALAERVAAQGSQIGLRIFKYHKPLLCWFVLGYKRAKGKGHAMPSVGDWLAMHDVDEDEYSTESAYKLFQRFGWDFDAKNRLFSGRMKGKPGAEMTAKKRARAKNCKPVKALTFSMRDIDVELATGRFMQAYRQCFRVTPVFLYSQARIYAYITMQGLSTREAAKKLARSQPTIWHSLHSFRNRMERNPTVARLMADACALPEPK